MKTKIGEIKTIEDLFEKTGGKRIVNPEADQHIQVILEKVKCKLCGDKFEMPSREGAINSGWDWEKKIKAHLELHKIVGGIGLTLIN